MSKELEALDKLCDLANCGDLHFHVKHNVWTRLEGINKYKPIIETALKEHEEHRQILNDYGLSLVDFRHACFTFAQFKNSKGFEGVEKKLKALEVIKKKIVDVGALIELDLELYNKYVNEIKGTPTLTQEEYDLLKEGLL